MLRSRQTAPVESVARRPSASQTVAPPGTTRTSVSGGARFAVSMGGGLPGAGAPRAAPDAARRGGAASPPGLRWESGGSWRFLGGIPLDRDERGSVGGHGEGLPEAGRAAE